MCMLFILLPVTLPLAKTVQLLKGRSSKWINETEGEFSWEEGYGAFSVSASQTADVVRYIQNQRTHHEKKSFQEELVEFLKRYGLSYEPEYVLG